MARTVWETVENNGKLVVSDWDIPRDLLGKLESKLDLLSRAEIDPSGQVKLPSGMVAGPNIYRQKWIYKLKVNGTQALRPMFCLGPVNDAKEWTVLARAREKDDDTSEQRTAAATATTRRGEILKGERTRYVLIDADD